MKHVSAGEDSTPLPPRAVGRWPRPARLLQALEEDGTLVVAVGAFAIAMLAALRTGLATDGWLALVAGREIVDHGLPAHDTLTSWTSGRSWADQQWLSQLALYGLWRLGGLKLALLMHGALAVGALAGAATLARRLGASARSATWIVIPALVCYYPGAAVMRPQSFAYPLFVAVLALLVTGDARSLRVYAVFPLLVLWANLHGSVLLGAGMVTIAGAVAFTRVAHECRRGAVRALSLVALPWVCVLASPYALDLPRYYEQVTVGGDFGTFVTEWAPTTLTAVTAPFYLLILGAVWLLGRSRRDVPPVAKLVLVATAVLGLEAVRNITWFALVAVAVMPVLLDDLRPPAAEPRRLNRLLATAVIVGVLAGVAAVVSRDTDWFVADFPPAAASAAAAAAGQSGAVLATSSYADWLLWLEPQLRGRVAYDARFELLTSTELKRAQRFQARVEGWRETALSNRVLVVGREDDRQLVDSLRRLSLARVVRTDGDIVVLRTAR